MSSPGDTEDMDWLFDYVMTIFTSPTWEVPIMTFIDDHCVVFDDDEENKFEYTTIHRVSCRHAHRAPPAGRRP